MFPAKNLSPFYDEKGRTRGVDALPELLSGSTESRWSAADATARLKASMSYMDSVRKSISSWADRLFAFFSAAYSTPAAGRFRSGRLEHVTRNLGDETVLVDSATHQIETEHQLPGTEVHSRLQSDPEVLDWLEAHLVQ